MPQLRPLAFGPCCCCSFASPARTQSAETAPPPRPLGCRAPLAGWPAGCVQVVLRPRRVETIRSQHVAQVRPAIAMALRDGCHHMAAIARWLPPDGCHATQHVQWVWLHSGQAGGLGSGLSGGPPRLAGAQVWLASKNIAALTKDGGLFAAGDNTHGQLGSDRYPPPSPRHQPRPPARRQSRQLLTAAPLLLCSCRRGSGAAAAEKGYELRRVSAFADCRLKAVRSHSLLRSLLQL